MVKSQTPITIGTEYEITSTHLKEKRKVLVQLPKNYDSKREYPVLYVTDGEKLFELVNSIQKLNTNGLFRVAPESIIVGIVNTERSRDLTPTNGNFTSFRGGSYGGAETFTSFIENELKPFIEKQYKTNGYDVLIGHSFGGLYVHYIMMNHPELFKGYISIDPSLWWDQQLLYKTAQEKWSTLPLQGKRLFVALAHEEVDPKNDSRMHSKTIRQFCEEIIDKKAHPLLTANWKEYPDLDHSDVVPAAMYDGLKYIFKGITLPIKQIPNNPELLSKNYDQFSKNIQHPFTPDTSLLIDLIDYAERVKAKEENLIKIKNYARSFYPNQKEFQ